MGTTKVILMECLLSHASRLSLTPPQYSVKKQRLREPQSEGSAIAVLLEGVVFSCAGDGKPESLALRDTQSEVSVPHARMPVDKVFKVGADLGPRSLSRRTHGRGLMGWSLGERDREGARGG